MHTTVATPDGPFTIIVDAQHVLASGWTEDHASLRALIHPQLRNQAEYDATRLSQPQTGGPLAPGARSASSESVQATSGTYSGPAEESERSDALINRAVQAVQAYYSGKHGAVAEIPVRQRSGPYRERAWEVLRQVKPGQPVSYAEYARRTGSPAAIRAAAGACAQNAAALFVPCHRVIRTDGSLGGFRYGLEIKTSLLNRERQPKT
ncbi:methylated-DNA--[protein]-cysteine S-methyltransferase [Nesterenkonia ebinurensis]|uniref:methylated-DNA--[protein]-cysteine S-methyltransferase n=1 Tax=Nesterenkonia ebinurensis TaxID=2608252 RepID=UPI00123D3FBA|nr:methylated-DNA--[protein]-cysteine S-methyltransferase [Nesterenkonia ebinurensis]